MKFKMAPNSGFAILLRSPWWISFVIVAVIIAACSALLPSNLAPFGAIGAFPVFVIGCMAAWRQLRAPSPARLQATLETAASLNARDFAQQLSLAWRAEGHTVEAVNGPAADLRITQGAKIILVNSRRFKASTHGVEPLKELQAEVTRQSAQAGVYVALQGTVSENARLFARDHGLVLLEGDTLGTLLLKANAA